MTRQVRWASQQRVDQPDIQAVSAFLTQDLRRILRVALMGDDAVGNVGRVLRGFQVVPENPGVSPRVVIRLDNGGGILSAFMGAIDQGGGQYDWGQIGGDADGLGNLEGSAQNIIDFTGQPAATYEVKVRAVFAEGVQDNRAFWNPATNAEFIQPTNTRYLPQWEVAITGHAGSDWVSLAEVVWDGSDVDTADVADLRVFPFEGQPRPGVTADEAWSHATQNDADTYGVGDFNRSEDRAAQALHGVWAQMRAVERQLQDIKGGRESDLRFDWGSRVFAPPGFLAADPNDKTTKSLRSIDTVSFTVADGVTEQGDFNGVSALNDCFSFIEANEADLPNRIDIVVKGRAGAPDFTWDTQVEIESKHIVVRTSGTGTRFIAGILSSATAHVEIDPSGTPAVAGSMLTLSNGSVLQAEGLSFLPTPSGVNWITASLNSTVQLKSCLSFMGESGDGAGVGYFLSAPSTNLVLDDCFFVGDVYIGGRVDFGGPQDGNENHTIAKAHIVDTAFNSLVRLRRTKTPSGADGFYDYGRSMVFERCFFYGFAVAESADGALDISGAKQITWRDCEFLCNGDQNMVSGIAHEFDTNAWIGNTRLLFDNCQFAYPGDASHEGTLTGAGGVSGSGGTGWAISLRATPDGTEAAFTEQFPTEVMIKRCQFKHLFVVGTATPIECSADAGMINIADGRVVKIHDNHFFNLSAPGAALGTSDIHSVIRVQSTTGGAAVGSGQHVEVLRNVVDRWYAGVTDTLLARHIVLDLVLQNAPRVEGNTLSAERWVLGGQVIRPPALPSAMVLNNCIAPYIKNNRFLGWRHSTDLKNNNVCVGIIGVSNGAQFSGNEYTLYGGNAVVAEAGAVVAFATWEDETFAPPTAQTDHDACVDLSTFGASSDGIKFNSNRWSKTTVPSNDALRLVYNPVSPGNIMIGNLFQNGRFVLTGYGTPGVPDAFYVGYASASELLNRGVAYA